MALAGALCTSLLAVTGITNRSLRARVAGLLGTDYTTAQMSYALRRLRMKGVIARLPGANMYTLTADGTRVAVFYTKLHDRLLLPLTAANDPPAPLRLRQALHTIDTYIDDYKDSPASLPETWLKNQEPYSRGSLEWRVWRRLWSSGGRRPMSWPTLCADTALTQTR